MLLTRLQKIAFSRVLTDLIEADFVVEEKEMAFYEKVISKKCVNISEAMLVEGKKMDYAKAIAILKELSIEDRKEIIDLLKGLSLVDGVSVPLEAIQVFALKRALENDDIIYSIPNSNMSIPNLTALFIVDENTFTNSLIEDNYRTICNYFILCGFEFIHIPNIVKDFALMDGAYLRKVVKYLIPSSSSENVDRICNDLCKMTTERFCNELLYRKLALNIQRRYPSLLIKINESIIVDPFSDDEAERTDYCNYLQIKLNAESPIEDITDLLDMYHKMINNSIIVESRPRHDKFYYSGFHRFLFDLIAYSKELKEYKLVFDISCPKSSVYFEAFDDSNDRLQIKLSPQETTLFLLIAKESIKGKGLDWREHIPRTDKNRILKDYNSVYQLIGKGQTINEYKDRTQTNHIKNKLRVLKGISNINYFIPEYYKEGNASYYRILADNQHIKVLE